MVLPLVVELLMNEKEAGPLVDCTLMLNAAVAGCAIAMAKRLARTVRAKSFIMLQTPE